MESTFLLRTIGIVVLVPTTLVAVFWTFLGVPALVDAIAEPSVVYPTRAWWFVALLVAGWFGIVTLWRLYSCFEADGDPGDARVHWAGLAAGSAATVALLLRMPGDPLIALPLIAAFHLGWRLHRSRRAGSGA